jgi:hypothetical protein
MTADKDPNTKKGVMKPPNLYKREPANGPIFFIKKIFFLTDHKAE